MERMLEAFTTRVFRALSLAELKNMNQLRMNFPAIDLADDDKRVAVQVTSNASPAKIRKTIEKFEKTGVKSLNLCTKYDTLYIFGFCKLTEIPVPGYCRLMSTSTVVNHLIENADEDSIHDVLEAIHRHQSYSSLHPWNDKDSLEIVLNLINRNAIKHRMSCEGMLANMTTGLNEISELIGKGTVNRKERSKSISDFADDCIKQFLRDVMDNITSILAVVNASSRGGYVNVPFAGMQQIDLIKQRIADDASMIARQYGIKIHIATVGK